MRRPHDKIKETLAVAGLALALSALGGCSLRYDFTECSADADCLQVEGGGKFYVCDTSANQCVTAQGIECRANADCASKGANMQCVGNTCISPDTDMSSDMAQENDLGGGSCTTNTQCQAADKDSLCDKEEGKCVRVVNEDCPELVMPKSGNVDQIVLVATLVPLIEPFGTVLGTPLSNAVKFAQREFNGEGGLPDGRKIALVVCDTKGNAAVGSRAASHVIDTLKVPAIVGPLFSEVFIAAATDVAKANGTFIISPTATSPAITNLHTAQDNTIWRNVASDEFQGVAFVKRVEALGVPNTLILYKDDKYGKDLQEQISPALISLLGPANVKIAKYDNPITIPDQTERRQKYGQIIGQALADFEPQSVLILGTSEGAEIGGAYLTVASASNKSLGKIIFSHGVIPTMADFFKALPESQAQAFIQAKLVEGIAPDIFDPNDQTYKDFTLAYNLAFEGTQSALPATTSFDAAMTIFFAMSALPANDTITGRKIANNIGRLVDKSASGVEVRFFTTGYISKATSALSQGKGIDMIGTSGALDYDTTRGAVFTRQIGWEVIPDAINGYTIKQVRQMLFPNAPATTGSTWTELP